MLLELASHLQCFLIVSGMLVVKNALSIYKFLLLTSNIIINAEIYTTQAGILRPMQYTI